MKAKKVKNLQLEKNSMLYFLIGLTISISAYLFGLRMENLRQKFCLL